MSKNNTVFIGKNKSFWDRNRRSEGYLLKREMKRKFISVARALLLFGLCFMIIQPMLIRFSTGFMEEREARVFHAAHVITSPPDTEMHCPVMAAASARATKSHVSPRAPS